MKFSASLAAIALLLPTLVSGQGLVESNVEAEEVPAAAIASAVKAVDELGKSVVQGRFKFALDRMNPKEKDRLAKEVGGLEALEKKLEGVSAEMVKQGVRIISSKPQGKPEAYGVEPKMVTKEIDGKEVSRWFFSQWLLVVPTVTRFELLHRVEGQPAKWIQIESLSFQVAVSDRNKEDWTFIDGAGLTVGRLCNLYKTLPADIKLPEVHKRQIKQ